MTCLMIMGSVTANAEGKPVSVDKLPAKVKQFIQQNFGSSKISMATMDKDIMNLSYDVYMDSGCKVEFNRAGEWTEVDCKKGKVPSGVVPKAIGDYVAAKHSGQHIVKIDRDKRDYELELSNGEELKFDMNYNLIGYDR